MNRTITISHEYDSGRREIDEKLAQRLGIPFYDRELIAITAEEGNIEASVLEASDKVDPDLDNYSPRWVPPDCQIAMTRRIYVAQATVVRSPNDKGPCTTVGCCADTIFPDAISISVFADMESRINRIMSLNPGLAKEEAKASILAMDERRKTYHEYYSIARWGDMNAHDIYLNSELADVGGCLEAALTCIKYVK